MIAAGAVVVARGDGGAVIEGVKLRARAGELAVDFGLDLEHALESEDAAADGGLVGDDDAGEAGGAEVADGVGRAWEQADLGGVAQVMNGLDDGAIAVEEDGWGHGSVQFSVFSVQLG